MADPETTERAVVTQVRRDLMKAANNWESTRKRAKEMDYGDAVGIAEGAAAMATAYAYTLAAVLGIAEKEYGAETAHRLASEAEEILINGDFDDHNADVRAPAAPTA